MFQAGENATDSIEEPSINCPFFQTKWFVSKDLTYTKYQPILSEDTIGGQAVAVVAEKKLSAPPW
jgi:hypothetical protein